MQGKGGQFYGAVTVSERGQIVIPAQARRDLGIEVGEKLLAIAGPSGALILIRADLVVQWTDLAQRMAAGLVEINNRVEEADEQT